MQSTQALATENGNQHYPLGVNSAATAILPPPGGTQLFNYNVYVGANKFAGDDGNSEIPDFALHVFVEAPRLVHTWGFTWNGIKFSSGFALSFLYTSIDLPAGHGDHRFGIGDPDLQPFYATYDTPTLHLLIGPNVWVPIGTYDQAKAASAGLNYWTIAPEIALTWIPIHEFEADLDSITEFNTRNETTKYHSGTASNVDYAIGVRPIAAAPRLQLGVVGYFYEQWTDDTASGHRGQVLSVGPQVRYDVIEHGGLLVKWQHETLVRNRPEGDRIWLEFAVPL